MKTPEDIKNGLAVCATLDGDCENCPYDDGKQLTCVDRSRRDALAYIQHLESRLAQAERERDAAKKDLENSAPCFACYHFIRNNGACKGGMRCCDEQFKAEIGHSEYDGPEWKWRGECQENTKEGNA